MEDTNIIGLFFQRDSKALDEFQGKYGRYCKSIAANVLCDERDADECVNDAYLALWNLIPPNKPISLKAYAGTVVRNIAIDRFDYNNAQKRSRTNEITDEFFECMPENFEDTAEKLAFKDLINGFLSSLDKSTRVVFMQRYWYFCSVAEIAEKNNCKESKVKVMLHRTRNKLKEYLEKEGIKL